MYDASGFIAGVGTTNDINDYASATKLEDQKRFQYASDLIVGNDAQLRFDYDLITAGKKSVLILPAINLQGHSRRRYSKAWRNMRPQSHRLESRPNSDKYSKPPRKYSE